MYMHLQASHGLGQIPFPERETSYGPALLRPLTEREVMLVAKSVGAAWGDRFGNIDVFAQRAIVRLSRSPATAADAHGLLDGVKSRALRGIFIENQKVPALRAQKLGTWYGKLIPPGKDAVLVAGPPGSSSPPLIAFRDSIKRNPVRLDPALVSAWRTFEPFGQAGQVCATCGGHHEPRCGKRSLRPDEEAMVRRFLDSPSPDPGLVGMTIADTIVSPLGTPEHVAAIFRRTDGSLRLGAVFTSRTNPGVVHLQSPPLCNKPHAQNGEHCVAGDEAWIGAIHTHPGSTTTALCQSSSPDLPAARGFATNHPTFTHSYVVGASGYGPYFGVVLFEPRVGPNGRLTTLTPVP